MKIAAIEKSIVGLIFHKEPTRDGLYLYWDNAERKFYTSVMQPGMPMRALEGKYSSAKDEAEARKLAAEFFAELGEDD